MRHLGSTADTRYTSKIIKAGALMPDTKALLLNWDNSLSVRGNLARIEQENLLGKASRSRTADIVAIFRQRYLADRHLLPALITFSRSGVSDESLTRILYFQTVRADALLHDAVVDFFAPRMERGERDIHINDLVAWINGRVAAGTTERPWSEAVVKRVAQGILSTLRDFGVLQGAVQKQLAFVYLPTDAFAFIAFQLSLVQPSGDRLLNDPEWRLFFFDPMMVERFFLEAHQQRLLTYLAAGRVIRIEFPAKTLEEYARALTQRAD